MNSSKKNCLLSVAMIVKNEAHNLDRALGSISSYVDEIIIVDTGSTDETVEVAKKYTDKIYFYEWRDDFSEARNYSLQFATCEWVLIYDADEEVKESFANIREFLKSLPNDVNTIYLPTISYLDWDLKKTEVASIARIFRNGTVKYENIVHNQAKYKGKVVEASFPIYHYGYIWTRKLKEKKYNRTKNLLVKMLQEDLKPAEKIYYLCQLYKTEAIYENKHQLYALFDEIYGIVSKEKLFTNIAFEIFFLHSMELLKKSLLDDAEKILNFILKLEEHNPDAYYGLVAVYEARKDYEKALEYGKKYLAELKTALENPEKYLWTVISIKYQASVRAVIAIALLKKGLIEEFKDIYYQIFESANLTGENLTRFYFAFYDTLLNIDDETYKKISNEIDYFLKELAKVGLKFDFSKLLEKDLRSGREMDLNIYKNLELDKIEQMLIERLENKKDMLLEYFFGKNPIERIKEYGVGGLIFYFENIQKEETEKLKFLNEVRKNAESKDGYENILKGVSLSLMGDIYLKVGNFKLAIEYYKKSVETLPEISSFVKPVLDDLKTKLDSEVNGVFSEIKEYYLKNREFFTDLHKKFNKEELKKLYLISETDVAKYISAVFLTETDKKRAKELLQSIKEKDKFPFYNYRYAKIFENSEDQEELKLAFKLHLEACIKNKNVGDIELGLYPYDGFYPSYNIKSDSSKIVWVGNISEKHSGLNVISPVRMWLESEEYYYTYPFSSDEALRDYLERLEKTNLPRFKVTKFDCLKILNEVNWENFRILNYFDLRDNSKECSEYEELIQSIYRETGTYYSKESENVLSFDIINISLDLESLLKEIKRGVFFYFLPDFSNRNDILWYYPYFRIFRTKRQLNEKLKRIGFTNVKHILLTNHLRAVIFEK